MGRYSKSIATSLMLASTVLLAPHFTARELGADLAGIPAQAQANLYKVAAWLEVARAQFGNLPITVTSGYRSPEHNTEVDGSDTSDHPNGLAADFRVSLGWFAMYGVLKTGNLPPWDQIIFYPIDGHVHLGMGSRMRGEMRVRLAETGYPILTPELAAKLHGAVPSLLFLLFAVLLVIYVARKGVT